MAKRYLINQSELIKNIIKICKHNPISTPELADKLNINKNSLRRYIYKMSKEGTLQKVGSARWHTKYISK